MCEVMPAPATLKYFGWSGISLKTDKSKLVFDPFFRPYCGAEWFHIEDFADVDYICVTHGHEEHFLDVPVVAKRTGAKVIAAPSVCSFLRRRHHLPPGQLLPIDPRKAGTIAIPGFRITTFLWQHRDINIAKAITKAVFHRNTTQLAWAWSSAVNAPFYSPYTGFFLELDDGVTILNYNEGFNSKMTDREIEDLGRTLKTDILLAGMQLNFIDDVVRGVGALKPKIVILYPPHDKFHEMMGATSAPWTEFERAVKRRFPAVVTYVAEPGFELSLDIRRLLAATAAAK